jgi:hypothetical protein
LKSARLLAVVVRFSASWVIDALPA